MLSTTHHSWLDYYLSQAYWDDQDPDTPLFMCYYYLLERNRLQQKPKQRKTIMFAARFASRKELRTYYIIRGAISITVTALIALVFTICYAILWRGLLPWMISFVIVLWILVPVAALEFLLRYTCAVRAFAAQEEESQGFAQTTPTYPQQYYAQPQQAYQPQQPQENYQPVVYSQQPTQNTYQYTDQKL